MKTKRHIKKNGLRKTKKKRFVYGGTVPVLNAVQTIVDSGLDISISAEQKGKRELIKYIREQYNIFKQSNIFLQFLYGVPNLDFSAENIQSSIIQITTFLQVIMYGKQVNPGLQDYNGLPDRDIVTLTYFHQRLLLYYKDKKLNVEILLAELENLSLPDKSGRTDNRYPFSLEDNDIRNIIKIIRAVLIVNTQEPTTVDTINDILQNTDFLNGIIKSATWKFADVNSLILKIICFLDIVAKARQPDLRRELISGMLKNINIISNPNITNILTLAITTSQEERVCVFSDTDLTLEMLESQTIPYFDRYRGDQPQHSMTPGERRRLHKAFEKMSEISKNQEAVTQPVTASGTSPNAKHDKWSVHSATKGILNALWLREKGQSTPPLK